MTKGEARSIPTPDWSSRPWGRPTIYGAESEANRKLVGMGAFKYYGMRVRGVKILRSEDGNVYVNMPCKLFGVGIETVAWFSDPLEQKQFDADVAWLWWSIFGERYEQKQLEKARG